MLVSCLALIANGVLTLESSSSIRTNRRRAQRNDNGFGVSDRLDPISGSLKEFIQERNCAARPGILAGSKTGIAGNSSEAIRDPWNAENNANRRILGIFWLISKHCGSNRPAFEFACLAEEIGKSQLEPEDFHCSVPHTGNMVLLILCGSEQM